MQSNSKIDKVKSRGKSNLILPSVSKVKTAKRD